MKTTFGILAAALIAGGTMFAQPRVAIGVGVGGYGPGYYPPPAYARYMPPCPGPDYVWTDGYWALQGGSNVWIDGYWRSPYMSGYRMAPRYVAPRYFAPRYENSYRGYDRGYQNSYRGNARGYEGRNQNRGGERNQNRGRGTSNSFRR